MIKKLRILLVGVAASCLVSTPVIADDTEIYLGQNLGVSDVPANILFVVDTSGSMDGDVITQSSYDPSVTYSGCFDTDRVYTTSSTNCGTSRYFNLSALKCQAAIDNFAVSGFYSDKMGQWRSNQWRSIKNYAKTDYVECRSDSGVHGDGGSETYAANGGSGPWSSNSGQSINWWSQNSYTLRSGNYKNWESLAAASTKSRLEVVQETITNLVNSINDVNIGLMRFDRYTDGGMVVAPMKHISDATAKQNFLNELDRMYPNGGTPLAQALYEAALYYRGSNVEYGNHAYAYDPTNGTYSLNSVPDSRAPVGSARYDSPIDFQCQKNFIVFLTDGEPSSNDHISTTQRHNIGAESCDVLYDSNDGGTSPDMYHCLPQIAAALARDDQSSTFADDQKVSTYTIGFATDQTLLEDTAAASKANSGAGEYYTADDSVSLTNAFTNIITDILGVSSTFSSPAVSVNAFNRTAHRSDLYFSLFKPDTGPHWNGNFKRYKLAFDTDGNPLIVDVNGDVAVNDTTGYFAEDATSYWTPAAVAPDGKDAEEGGAASKLTTTRNVYTYTGSSSNLSDSTNLVDENNSDLTKALLGISAESDQYRDDLIKWMRGIDVKDANSDGSTSDARQIMGDPLHSEPALIQYGGSDADPDLTAYVATNDGYLHAINTRLAEGTEIFSFIPQEMLANMDTYYTDSSSQTKIYGIDGSISSWVTDANNDGIVNGTDHVYLYFGMRRGGNHYYALDVTDRANPRLMWTITGGTGDYAELGETWSKPILHRMRIGGADRTVMVVGGGYDVGQDAVSVRTQDGVGRAVYIIDAETGARLWWASSVTGADLSLSDMDYSIPSDVAVIDSNGDGYMNMMYVGDMGGQVWRFDIEKSETDSNLSNLITGGRIADLAQDGSTTDNRRFYYPPDVARTKSDSSRYLSLIMSTGYRAHPMETDTQDRIYMIKDLPISGAPTTYTTLDESDLFDTTDNLIGEGSDAEKAAAYSSLSSSQGWYIDMELPGEKGLSRPVIFAGIAFITTYIPTDTSSGQSCAPSEGGGRVYMVNLSNGTPVYSNDPTVDPDDLTKDDRFKVLAKAGIPGDPNLIRTDDPNQKNWAVCVGTECFEGPDSLVDDILYWFEL